MEHRRPDGSWAQGYYCTTCGKPGLNMLATGHEDCEDHKPELVARLHAANPPPRIKPRFVLIPSTKKI